QRQGVLGINVSRNKLLSPESSPEAIATVADMLYDYADYFVINYMSPNTPGLRASMMQLLAHTIDVLRDTQATDNTENPRRIKPIIVKTSVDMPEEDIYQTIRICDEHGASGICDSNTTNDETIKAKYGWEGRPGGVSGNDDELRKRATERMRFITRESRGTN